MYSFSIPFILVCVGSLFVLFFLSSCFKKKTFLYDFLDWFGSFTFVDNENPVEGCDLVVCLSTKHSYNWFHNFLYFRWRRLKNKRQFLNHILNREELLCQKDICLAKLYCLIRNSSMHGIFPDGVVI